MGRVIKSVALYARISSDQDGTGLGVARQLEDCRGLADRLGWQIGAEYCDNDLSAYSGKTRPEYQRMLRDLAAGLRDAVIVYHADRLTRRPVELEEFLSVIERAGVRDVRFVAGADVDIGNGDGLLVLRVLSAVAANESASKSRRIRRKHEEIAAAGRPNGGSHRPFGYEPDRITIRESEAIVIRAVMARFLAGESTRSIATSLDDGGIRTTADTSWTTTALRKMLCSARNAGLRSHRGEIVGPAVWDAIVAPTERDRALALFAQRARATRRTPRRYLLSGSLRCGRCGNVLYSSPRQQTRRYVCLSGPDHHGCGRLTVVAVPVEDLVTAAVLYRLDTPELAAALTGAANDDAHASALAAEIAADQLQLDELAQLYGDKHIPAREWLTARTPIEQRIHETQRRLAKLTRNDALDGLAGNGSELRTQWDDLNLSRQAAIINAIVAHITIEPRTPGARALDPTRVNITWRY